MTEDLFVEQQYKMKTVRTFSNLWLESFLVSVEADSSKSLPGIEIIGLPDASIKEAKQRIRSTFRNIWIKLPNKKFILNLAPSDIKKIGTSFDLPMAVAILSLVMDTPSVFQEMLFFWELGLDGSIKRVNGILPAVISAIKKWYTTFCIPAENAYELAYIPDIEVIPLNHMGQLLDHIQNWAPLPVLTKLWDLAELAITQTQPLVDFADIKGHLVAKRAMSIAAAGQHNVLMVGAPWCGKTMLSKALQGILPPLSFPEILEVSQIYSVVGKLDKGLPLITNRPFRQVHHTASKVAIVGWGQQLTPWEVSLAHKGILFFDELTEFPREVLEVLRQPIEDKTISISRVSGTVQYPANFMFVASMNPCKCWYYQDPEVACKCSLGEIQRYQSKISGPLMDRIDMILEIPRQNIDKILSKTKIESSESLRKKVITARKIQQERFADTHIFSNAHMTAKHIDQYITLTSEVKDLLSTAATKLTLSARLIHRIIKLARTIADMEWKEYIWTNHIAEALQYRSKNMFVQG